MARHYKYESWAEHLRHKSEGYFSPTPYGEENPEVLWYTLLTHAPEVPPLSIGEFFSELVEYGNITNLLSVVSRNEAGWLAQHIDDHITLERSRMGDAIEEQLKVSYYGCFEDRWAMC